jgi:hypothetical protein
LQVKWNEAFPKKTIGENQKAPVVHPSERAFILHDYLKKTASEEDWF